MFLNGFEIIRLGTRIDFLVISKSRNNVLINTFKKNFYITHIENSVDKMLSIITLPAYGRICSEQRGFLNVICLNDYAKIEIKFKESTFFLKYETSTSLEFRFIR